MTGTAHRTNLRKLTRIPCAYCLYVSERRQDTSLSHINGKAGNMTRKDKWAIFALDSAGPCASGVTGWGCRRRSLPTCAAWTGLTWAGSNVASGTWRWTISKRLRRRSGFRYQNYTVAQTCLAAIGDVSRFANGKKLAAYLGSNPSTRQSGPHCYHGPITKQGNAHARWLLVQAAQHLGRYRGPLGRTFRKIAKRKYRKVAVVACARELAVLVWQLLISGEPFRYGEPRSLEAKFSRLRARATGRRRRGGVPRGTPRSAQYGHGRTRAVPSLAQVLEANGLPETTPPARGERRMLDEKRLHAFYTELQVASRREVNRGGTQVEEQKENAKTQLTQS